MNSPDRHAPFVEKMQNERLPRAAIRSFELHLARLLSGDSVQLGEDQIRPVTSLPQGDDLERYRNTGERLLSRAVVIKLNGGLGTGMGLRRAKSLIEARDGASFLELIVRQVGQLRADHGRTVPLVLMNSYRTHDECIEALKKLPELADSGLPLTFKQHKVPKVHRDHLCPVRYPDDPSLEWCPPGHGDLFTALGTSGALMELLERGIEYAFVSNADNLGAVLDPRLLGYMSEHEIDFLMEAADRTESDRKGGHLCLVRSQGLALRERAQCPIEDREEFQNISKYRYFNTNNLWFHLPTAAALMDHHGGVLPLHTILNEKRLDPIDPDSDPVYHLETAMGAAISLFPNAAAVRVKRNRFSPVKTTADLLAIRSDAYVVTDDWRVVLSGKRSDPPSVRLDNRYYSILSAFEKRFPHGPPSLLECDSLEIRGDIRFGREVRIVGNARLSTSNGRARVPDGAVLTGSCVLD